MKKETSTWAEALGTHATLIVGGSAATLALLVHSWPIAGAGAVACGALFAVDRLRKEPVRLPPLDPATAAAMVALAAARADLERTLAETEPSLRSDLAPLVGPIEALVTRANGLARRSAEIAAYLAQRDVGTLRRECEALGTRAAQAADDAVRTQYLAARATRLGHLQTLGDLAAAKERIGATLLSIVAAVEALPPKIVRLRGLSVGGDATRDVERELSSMTDELGAFERLLVQVHQEVTAS